MTIPELIDGLIRKDNALTRAFFYGSESWSCRLNLLKILYGVYRRPVDYDEAVGDLYAYLMAGDGRHLRSYDPAKSSFFYWFRTVAVRFFLDRRDGVIDSTATHAIVKEEGSEHVVEAARRSARTANLAAAEASEADERLREAKADVQRLLFRMPNKRYAYVLQQLIVLDAEPKELAARMGIEVSNLYNIRRRAYEQLEKTVLKDNLLYHGKQGLH